MKRLSIIAVLVAAIAVGWIAREWQDVQGTPPLAIAGNPASVNGVAPPGSYRDVVAAAMPGVVNIATSRTVVRQSRQDFFGFPMFGAPEQRQEQSLGSGVVLSADGVIVTNNHVVKDADEIVVFTADNTSYPATLVGVDAQTDLAVLHIVPKAPLHPLAFGDSEAVAVGDVVLAIGNPFGVGQTVTSGIVSALGKTQLGINEYEDFIQTDAAINPGNSGGALIDTTGGLIGINSAIYSKSGGSMGIGFAIPANLAKIVVESIQKNGRMLRGYVGIAVQPVTADVAQALGMERSQGVLVSDVSKDGPAAQGGLKAGDVILAINGHAVRDPKDLRVRTAYSPVESTIDYQVLRDGKTMQVQVKVAAQELVKGRSAVLEKGKLAGLTVEDLNSEWRDGLKLPENAQGVVVTQVKNGSPAAQIGFEPGIVILAINRQPILNVGDLLTQYGGGSGTLLLQLLVDGSQRVLVLR